MDVNTFLNISIFYLSFYFLVETYLVELHYVRLSYCTVRLLDVLHTSMPCVNGTPYDLYLPHLRAGRGDATVRDETSSASSNLLRIDFGRIYTTPWSEDSFGCSMKQCVADRILFDPCLHQLHHSSIGFRLC